MRVGLILFTLAFAFAAQAADRVFESGPQRVHLIELFTSQGCSSCRPAETVAAICIRTLSFFPWPARKCRAGKLRWDSLATLALERSRPGLLHRIKSSRFRLSVVGFAKTR